MGTGVQTRRGAQRTLVVWTVAACAACSAAPVRKSPPPRAAPSIEPLPASGRLLIGHRYRAVVRCATGGLCEARCQGPKSLHVIYLDTTTPEPDRDYLMVFEVRDASMFHTPTTAAGTHEWYDEYRSEPLSVEPAGEMPRCG